MSEADFFHIDDDGLTLTVRVTPKASRSAFGGAIVMPDGRATLVIRVAAPPIDGAANAALLAFLSKQLHVAKRHLSVIAGETSRLKIVRICGNAGQIADRLRQVVGSSSL